MKTTNELVQGENYIVEDYGYIQNDDICNIFGCEMTYNQLKRIHQFHFETTYLVVKTRKYTCASGEIKIHYMIHFNYDEKPILELNYKENHSCDMNFHLGEIAIQQDEEQDEEQEQDEVQEQEQDQDQEQEQEQDQVNK